MSSSYTYPLSKVTITASQVGTRIPVSVGGSFQQSVWVEINNESPYVLAVLSAQGILLNQLQPQICDIAPIPPGDTFFILVPTALLPGASPTSEVDINVYPFGQPSGAYPFPLGRQSAPTSGAGPLGFTAGFLFSTANANEVILNVFNPLNSGVNMQIYSARSVFAPKAIANSIFSVFAYQKAADNNFATAVTIVANNTIGTSKMHATVANADGSIVIPDQAWDNFAVDFPTIAPVIYEACPFDDKKQVPPGTQAIIYIQNLPASGGLGEIALKYTEL